ncbi:MAG: nitroreductase family deazaflavin-dependent oxidoreductase [Anaerolineales bacterium]|nr:nitroreductase family deazaflavin-dependent oxidoreductase [Anaerolineales bacterium]
MAELIKEPRPPRGIMRIIFRFPITLYRAGLGWVFGDRALMLTHIGRISDLPRQAVIEVMRYDKESDTYFIASGWGEKSDWFLNIQKNPHVQVIVGRRRFKAVAKLLPIEQAADEILRYARRYPLAFRILTRFIGYRVRDTEEDIRACAQVLPLFALHPDESVDG